MHLHVIAMLVFAVLSNAAAQESAQDSVKELYRRIDILAAELEALRLGEPGVPHDDDIHGMGPAAGKIYQTMKSGASISGYGEIIYENYRTNRDDNTAANKADKIDYLRNVIYVGYRFNDWILFNSEIEFEHAGKEVAIEFGYVELLLSSNVRFRAGMLLPPMGIVNEKHEPSTFFGTLRPGPERYIIPSTWRANGIGVYGDLSPFSYRLYLIEGLKASGFSETDGIRGGRQNGVEALAEDFGVSGRVDFHGLSGGLIGGSIYLGNSGQGARDSLGKIEAQTMVWDIHAEYSWKGLEARALYAAVTVDDAGRVSALTGRTIGSSMSGWYIVAGYDLMPFIYPGSSHVLAPFVQFEKLNTQAAVAEGFLPSKQNDRSALVFGLTYKPHANVAFKIDYRDNKNGAATGIDQWNVAVNYLF